MSLSHFWAAYDATLDLVRSKRPTTFAHLKVILDNFSPRGEDEAFFPGGADDTLAEALLDAGWDIEWVEGDYYYRATSPIGEAIAHVEGDVYPYPRR